MADITPPKQATNEPLIPMPSVSTPPAKDESVPVAPKVQPSPSKDSSSNANEPQTPTLKEAPKPATQSPAPAPAPKPETVAVSKPSGDTDLEDIKNKALNELKPIIDEIDLPADQKFHTILEIISATNDKGLIPKLYSAAEAIEDKQDRAKALIDVLSEIEYLNDKDS